MARTPKEEVYKKQLTALQLRLAGRSYFEIKEALGYKAISGAYNAVSAAMKKTLREPADEVRTMELDRIDRMLASVWPAVLNGHIGAIQTAIKLSEHRSKILGLYAPIKQDITSGGEVIKGYVSFSPDDWDKKEDGNKESNL